MGKVTDNTEGRTKTLITDTLLFGISNFGSKVLMFFLTPLYTSILATEEFGIADLINTTINFIYPVLTFAIAEATLRYAMMKDVSRKEVLNTSFLFIIAATLLLLLLYPFIGKIDNSLVEYWDIFVIWFVLYNIQLCISNFIKGIGMTSLFAIQGILHTITLVLFNILFLVIFKMGLDGYFLSVILGYIVPISFVFVKGKLYKYVFPFSLRFSLLKEMLVYSIPMIPTILAWSINTSIDKYMIIGFVDMGANGIYSVAHKIPTLLSTVTNIFLQAWQLSAISNSNAKDESEYYTKVYNMLNVLSIIGCMMIVPLSKWISTVLFDEAYYSAWECIPMLTIATLFSTLSSFLAAAFRAHMKTKSLFVSVAIGALINIILNWFFIRALGIVGAAIATGASFFVVWGVRVIMVQKLVRIRIEFIRTIVSYLIFIIATLFVTADVELSYIIFILLSLIVVFLNYKELYMLVDSIRKISKSMIKKLIKK